MRHHLESCETCRQRAAELERLFDAVRELPEAIAPPRDLWPGIEPRLASRRAASERWRWAAQMAAALALMVAGGVLSQLLWPSGAISDARSAEGRLAEEPGVGELAPAGLAAPARAELAVAEADYLRTKETLWLLIYRNRDELSPVTMRVVERNLRVVDEAIQELRQALEEDPGNSQLEGLLYANHRRGIDLLKRLAQSSAEA